MYDQRFIQQIAMERSREIERRARVVRMARAGRMDRAAGPASAVRRAIGRRVIRIGVAIAADDRLRQPT